MNTKKFIAVFVAALTVSAVFAKGKQDSGAVTGAATREIRKSDKPEFIIPPPVIGVEVRAEDQANFDAFVWSADKLKANYDHVLVVDARDKAQYDAEHLPGAVQFNWSDAIVMPLFDIPSDDVIAKAFAEHGVDTTKTIVVYNEPLITGWGEESRILWLLRYLGINDSYILNGGINYWKAQGGQVTNEKTVIPALTPVSSFNHAESLLIGTDELASRISEVKLFDTRFDDEFAKGRIPGCKFVWFKDFYHADGTYFTPAETRARIATLGFNEDDEIVTYCQGGIRSSLLVILLQTAGFKNPRNYSGSWAAWTATKQKIDDVVYSNIPAYN
ncbi:MAG: hypothetical protein LBF80_04205 [Spirochaetaceae bacterium]|jgi:thiosulfate/3-mercaptopyruvate sulfurtransferase|nr:hypothetical protein [Spirochaetaceae bacterium]